MAYVIVPTYCKNRKQCEDRLKILEKADCEVDFVKQFEEDFVILYHSRKENFEKNKK